MQPDPDQMPRCWRVARTLPALKLTGAVLLVLAGLVLDDGDRVRLALAVVGAAVLAGWSLRDLVAPVRLTADPTGITLVSGLTARRQRLSWSRIERIRVDRRAHRGLRSELLEIDAGESLHLLSAHDLGAPPAEVAAALLAIRDGADAAD